MCGSMYRSSPLRSTLKHGLHYRFGMCEVCTEAVHCVALWTRVTLQGFGHVWSMYRSSPLRSTLNTGYITGLGMCESMYRSGRLRSSLNTGYITGLGMCEVCTEAVHCVALWNTGYQITGLGMCEVCTEAVHCVALWTRVTSQVWVCVKVCTEAGPLRSTLNTGYITGFGHVWSMYRSCRLRGILKTTSFKKQTTRKHHEGFGPAGKNMFF